MRTLTLVFLLALVTVSLLAEPIAQQSFENNTSDNWNYVAQPEGMNRLVWWGRSDQPMGGASAQSGSWYWASWDLDNNEHSLTFDNVSLPIGFIYSLSFWYYTNGLDPTIDQARFCVEYDTGDEWTNWATLAHDTDAWTHVILDIPQQASTVRFKLAAQYDGFSKYVHWDNVFISNTPAPPTAPSVDNLIVFQRTDGSKIVEINYDLFDANGDLCSISLDLSTNGGTTFDYIPDPVNLSGDFGAYISPGPGKSVLWNAGDEAIDFVDNQFVIRITADDSSSEDQVYVEGGTVAGITVSDLYISMHETTQSEYLAVMGINPAYFSGNPNHPVEQVSWFDAIEYCNRRSIMEGLNPCYSYEGYGANPANWPENWNSDYNNHADISCDFSQTGYRLPTSAEWEYVARGGLLTHDYTYCGSNDIYEVSWFDGTNNPWGTKQVGLKLPNELCVYDMGGNVGEWCWNGVDHTRQIRGGAWAGSSNECRPIDYLNVSVIAEYYGWGFRTCRSASVPQNFVFVEGGTIYPAEGNYTGGLTVSDFYIDKYEMTNAEWNAVMGSGGGNDYPHANVSWFGAIEYCNRRSLQEGLTPCYSYLDYGTNPDDWPTGWNSITGNSLNVSCDWNATGYRLPSEAEWEYAARGGLQTHGYTYSGSNDLNEVGWYYDNGGGSSHPVGQLVPNELGTYDMSGNLREWVWDIYSGSNRVTRGGGFYGSASYCTVSNRLNVYATLSDFSFGFRICRVSP